MPELAKIKRKLDLTNNSFVHPDVIDLIVSYLDISEIIKMYKIFQSEIDPELDPTRNQNLNSSKIKRGQVNQDTEKKWFFSMKDFMTNLYHHWTLNPTFFGFEEVKTLKYGKPLFTNIRNRDSSLSSSLYFYYFPNGKIIIVQRDNVNSTIDF